MILDEKSSERFYSEINDGEISEKQQKFLKECSQLLERGCQLPLPEGRGLNREVQRKN